MSTLVDDLRKAIEVSGQSRYRISREADVAESQLCRLMSGERGLSVEAIERVADSLGYKVILKRKRKGR